MTLDEQRDTIERSLGERMLNHAFIILRQWLQEVGYDAYGDRLQSLEQNYDSLFQYYLVADDPERDVMLDEMTGATYRLVDEVYAQICLKRGRYPQMMGYNPENMQSVMTYFGSCPRLRDEDLAWVRQITLDDPQPALALVVLAAMMHVLQDCFHEEAICVVVEAMNSDNRLIADQALTSALVLLAHYDVRIDFFPHLQEVFLDAIGDGEHVYQVIQSLIQASYQDIQGAIHEIRSDDANLSDTINELIAPDAEDGEMDDVDHIISWVPKNVQEYMSGIVAILPSTWVFEVVIGDSEERASHIRRAYLMAGRMDVWWDDLEEAERIILYQLRQPNPAPQHYVNYGHICFLKGDRMMAYENYREAKRLLGSNKQFLSLFRPDRRFLVDRGITLEDVYLMEDQLLRS